MPPRLQQIRHVLPSDPFFPTITENQLLYLNTHEQREVKTKPWPGQWSRENGKFWLALQDFTGLAWKSVSPVVARAANGGCKDVWERMRSFKTVPVTEKSEITSSGACIKQWWVFFDKQVCSGKCHLSLPQGEVRMSVIELPNSQKTHIK